MWRIQVVVSTFFFSFFVSLFIFVLPSSSLLCYFLSCVLPVLLTSFVFMSDQKAWKTHKHAFFIMSTFHSDTFTATICSLLFSENQAAWPSCVRVYIFLLSDCRSFTSFSYECFSHLRWRKTETIAMFPPMYLYAIFKYQMDTETFVVVFQKHSLEVVFPFFEKELVCLMEDRHVSRRTTSFVSSSQLQLPLLCLLQPCFCTSSFWQKLHFAKSLLSLQTHWWMCV